MDCMSADLDKQRTHSLALPETGGWYVLSSWRDKAYLGPDDFKLRKTKSPGFFASGTGAEVAAPYVYPGSHKFVFNLQTARTMLAKKFVLEAVLIAQESVIVGQQDFQHAGAKWRGTYYLRSHFCLIHKDIGLLDAIAFKYRTGQSSVPEWEEDVGRNVERKVKAPQNSSSSK